MTSLLPDLRCRRREPELMDQPGLPAAEHARALEGLRRINAISRTASILWRQIEGLASSRPSAAGPLRVLDVATGGGSLPLALEKKARAAGLDARFDGCDISETAVGLAASRAAGRGSSCRYFARDALAGPLPGDYNVLTCSLFLHHLDEADAVALLRRMDDAALDLVLVDDLIRSRLGYGLAVAGCRLLSRSPIVHADGPASVAAAFTAAEALGLAERAAGGPVRLTRHWPRRFLLSWRPRTR
nr:methyltransferase domain-containing protein [Aquisphaera giovannonii]